MNRFALPGDDPPPQLLAAYFDGEIDDASLRLDVESWLNKNPEGETELDAMRRVREAMRETTPLDVSTEAWEKVLRNIRARQSAELERSRTEAKRRRRRGLGRWVGVAAACLLAVAGLRMFGPESTPIDPLGVDIEPFPVATAAEVEILHVNGDDTSTLVVGRLPLQGLLELIDIEGIDLLRVQPDARDKPAPQVRVGRSHHPMIWARLENDR